MHFWWFLIVCTTGQVQMNRYYVGNNVSKGMEKDTHEIKWFVRDFQRSVLSHGNSGTGISGSVSDLIDDVEIGSDVCVVTDVYAATMNSVQVQANSDLVVGQTVWHVSQRNVPPNVEFRGNDFWRFTNWATDGTFAASRWQIDDHINRNDWKDARAYTWNTDNCWTLAYTHDESGNEVQGSLVSLREVTLRGHRVKVMFDFIFTEPDMVIIREGHVNAQLISMVVKSSDDIRAFKGDGLWDWRILTTTGKETTLRVNVGEYVEQGRTIGKKAVSWFIDTRPWVKVLKNSKTGSVISGSKAALVSALLSGARVRYIVSFDSFNYHVSVQEADTLHVNGDEVSATHIRAVSVSYLPTEVEFQPMSYWVFTQSTTTGKVDMSRWTVGEHEDRGHNANTGEIEWFVNY